jgi:hypothetical protein
MCGVLSTGERNREIDSRKCIIFHCQKRHSHCSPWPATSQSNWVRFEFKTFFLSRKKGKYCDLSLDGNRPVSRQILKNKIKEFVWSVGLTNGENV